MRTRTNIATLLAVCLLAPVALAATGTGPFVGTVRQGQTDHHRYDNNPRNDPCIQVMTTYTVTLTYTPATDTLTLTAGGVSAVGAGGTATVTFEASWCTSFDIFVEGTQVARVAHYGVTVTRGDGTI